MRINKREPKSGIVTMLTVFHGGIEVGVGFQVWVGPLQFAPVLSTHDGKELSADWYTLRADSQHLAVVSLRVQ